MKEDKTTNNTSSELTRLYLSTLGGKDVVDTPREIIRLRMDLEYIKAKINLIVYTLGLVNAMTILYLITM